ncbi:tryptophan--tRNA ligase [bacterium BMS3Abin07]|nr:tryptophan--tRNA ligase [bacterium BMS3Abin07]GBE31409.1 tryptophan--tRNA ligase [bacterium BMS3Bbin05]HDO21442.1 tryptophan--tRNA ligase [Nitrospirota bacterium]HDZ87039.1 tryptophan--tRNA ligase [Nitrospirota bacterium]
MDRVLSGMQPSGYLHLGNLVGALQSWVKLQDDYECFYFVADWHALTTNFANPEMIKGYTEDLVLNFLAAGLDPEKCTMFVQSRILQHAEFHVLLSMITPLGWLERVPTYKEKKEEIGDRDIDSYGFLGYPVLQSADIMIYRARYVPVGIDQVPHLEITREICRRFNFIYKTGALVEPEPLLTQFPKVVGVDGRKMSKSYDNCIYLNDPAEVVEQKLKTMVTDPARKRRHDPGTPDLSPVFALHRIFSTTEQQEEVAEGCRTASIGCIDCKKILIDNIFRVLEPIWEKRKYYGANPSIIQDILETGTKKATAIAEETMQLVRSAMKFS